MGLRGLRNNWDQLGRSDPLWAVLSLPDKRGGKWDVEEFFATGEKEIDGVLAEMDRLGVRSERRRALDFGCGVGRLSQALALHFDEVVGVDIAPAMIDAAERLNRRQARCRFVLNGSPDLSAFPDAHFDFVYSSITLQHVPTPYTRRYLGEFLRVLVPGGLLVFQLPTEPRRGTSAARRLLPAAVRERWAQLRAALGKPTMQMYWMPRAAVEAALSAHPYRILAASPDFSAGTEWPSLKYYVRREAT